MLRSVGIGCLLLIATGCRVPRVATVTHVPMPSVQPVAVELPIVTPTKIEPDASILPTIDVKAAKPILASGPFVGLSDEACRVLAEQTSPIANTLDKENERPTVSLVTRKQPCPDTKSDDLARQLRFLAAREARNRSAAEALENYYRLADAEGRTELLAAGLRTFDQLRDAAPRFRAAGLPNVPDDEEFIRQRAKLLIDAEQAEVGIRTLNLTLKMQLGQSVKGEERFWPTGPFGVSAEPLDVEAAVQTALQSRPDLQFLRAMYHGLSPSTLPLVNQQLQSTNGLLGGGLPKILQRRLAPLRAAAEIEVSHRREQLFLAIADREKLAATEVRIAALQMESAARRVALAKSRAESARDKVTKAGDKLADKLPAEIEWYRARADLIVEIMAWHTWKVKYRAAQGGLVTPN